MLCLDLKFCKCVEDVMECVVPPGCYRLSIGSVQCVGRSEFASRGSIKNVEEARLSFYTCTLGPLRHQSSLGAVPPGRERLYMATAAQVNTQRRTRPCAPIKQ